MAGTAMSAGRRLPGRYLAEMRLGALAFLAFAALLAPVAGAAAQPVELAISFPEGFTVRLMSDRVAEVRRIAIRRRHVTPVLTGAANAAAAQRTSAPPGFGRPRTIEGFLFPSLYRFGPATRAPELIALQLDAFQRAWRTVDLTRAGVRHQTPYDVLTIASMIERETVAPEERRLVAAVIYDRLEAGMPLAIDATLRYGLGIPGTRSLTKAALQSASPYNTRRFKGLPPTPIGNPGLASIRAAAAPARSTTCTTSVSRTASTTSSPPTQTSSAPRRQSTATAAEAAYESRNVRSRRPHASSSVPAERRQISWYSRLSSSTNVIVCRKLTPFRA